MRTRPSPSVPNRSTAAFALLLAASSAHADDRARAEAATADLGQQLRAALVARIDAAGPVAAINFCHDQAPTIAADVAQKHGVRIGRTSLRVRSPANAPVPWQQSVLQDFAAQAQAGTPPQQLRYVSSEALPEGISLRYMQGIGTEAACLACHGQTLAEPVAQAIGARYPGDTATGFREGQLRGAFWVEVPNAPASDTRTVITMTIAQREELRAQMRAHLETVQAILAALADSDWDAVGRAAGDFGPGQGRGQPHSFRSALPEGWFTFARPMHQAISRIVDEALIERRSSEVIAELARATAQCTACHAGFRVESR